MSSFYYIINIIKKKVNTIAFFIIQYKKPIQGDALFLRAIIMKGYIEERALQIAAYIIENNATVRQTAKQFGISKSTVHKDMTERLGELNPSLAGQVRFVLDLNKSERHIRGGLATKEKYLSKKNEMW